MSTQQLEGPLRWPDVASPAAFAVLAAALGAFGAVGVWEAVTAVLAVAFAFVPCVLSTGNSLARLGVAGMLVPAAFALTMVGGDAMRQTLMPPLLIMVAWAALAAAWHRTPPNRRPLLAACFGLSARAATGLGMIGFGFPNAMVAVFTSMVVPWAVARRWGRHAAVLAGLIVAVAPLQRSVLGAAAVGVLAMLWGVTGRRRDLDRFVVGWIPGLGAALLLASSVTPWPGLSPGEILPLDGWSARAGMVVALIVTLRLRPGLAGALWFVATLTLAPPALPTPEHRAFDLTNRLGSVSGPVSTGEPYIVEFSVRRAGNLEPDDPVAVMTIAGKRNVLAVRPAPGAMRRPQGGFGADARWRRTFRQTFDIPVGERPQLVRHPGLDDDVRVRVESIGPARPTPPRSLSLPQWLAAAAVMVAMLQLLTATWRRSIAVVPWLVLVLGAVAIRAPIEPLHLVCERIAVDLALAAVMSAWLPAARRWLARGRAFAPVAALLVPLALATPQLTPPMYGDEPFHLMLMGSLAEDHDLDVSDDLNLEEHPQNTLYAPGRPLVHSPGLGLLLFPGYLVAGRTGALVLLALMGGVLAALMARRARELEIGASRVEFLVLMTAATYPLATFATQIWPELPGALAVAALLVLAAGRRGGRVGAGVVAVAAAVVKTRLALVTFPVMAVAWLRRRPLLGATLLAAAAAAVSVVGTLVMGHPFGPYRRLHDLWPSDPALAARVIGGLLFDAAGGLAFTAPLWIAAAAGALALWRRGGMGERALLVGCGLTVAALLPSSEWYGGGSPPARYLVAMLPAVVLAGGMALQRPWRPRRLALILLPPSVLAWWVLVTRPHFSINPGDGGYWLADALARRFAADARDFFPSFLVPGTATWAVPLAMVVVVAAAVWGASRNSRLTAILCRCWVGLWLLAAAGLVCALETVPDKVVEFEAPQIRRSGGRRVPAEGVVSQYRHPRGWRLDNGDSVVVPLRLGPDSRVVLEGWLLGTAVRRCDVAVRWDDETTSHMKWNGGDPPKRVMLPPPPGGGFHHLTLSFAGPPEGAIVLDRLVIHAEKRHLRNGGGG